MNEKLLHTIWKFQRFSKYDLKTTDGLHLDIIHPGFPNQYAGPDFLNAKIKLDNLYLYGHIEIHVRSNAWFEHQHHLDENYKAVMLHVVLNRNERKLNLPTLELNHRIPHLFIERYEQLMSSQNFIPCDAVFPQLTKLEWLNFKDRLVIERLERKFELIKQSLRHYGQDWQEVFYQWMAYNFGFKSNEEAFRQLSQMIPLRILAKHQNNLLQIEALLFGVSGLLNKFNNKDYVAILKNEFQFLQRKYNLRQMGTTHWNFGRIRPYALPTIRIAQFAALIHQSRHLFSKLMETTNIKEIHELLRAEPSDYWLDHFIFDKKSKAKIKAISKGLKNNIIINTIIPFQFYFNKFKGDLTSCEQSFNLLNQLPAEKNAICSHFEQLGIANQQAYDSQAIIQLYKNYCLKKACLDCTIGQKIFAK